MAKSAPKSKYRLEHRLVGAVVLVLVAVIIIPLILREPDPSIGIKQTAKQEGKNVFQSKVEAIKAESELKETLQIERVQKVVDSIDSDQLESVLEPLGDVTENNQKISTRLKVQEQSQKSAVQSSEKSNHAAQEQVEPDTQLANDESVNSTKQNAGNGTWEVRVGTFTKKDNAQSLRSILKKAGFNAKTTDTTNSLGNVTRVWLGPYANRETAEKIRDRLKALTDQNGFVAERTVN